MKWGRNRPGRLGGLNVLTLATKLCNLIKYNLIDGNRGVLRAAVGAHALDDALVGRDLRVDFTGQGGGYGRFWKLRERHWTAGK